MEHEVDTEPMDLGSSLTDFKSFTVPISQLSPGLASEVNIKPQVSTTTVHTQAHQVSFYIPSFFRLSNRP
jgi:hypothetical protein